MKTIILSLLAAVGLGLAPMAVVSAQVADCTQACQTNQDVTCATAGPESGCEVEATNENTCNANNQNNVNITTDNGQTTGSGNATGSGNTSVDGVGTGSSSAGNTTNVNGSITNGGCAPANSTTTTTPQPGRGEGDPQVLAANTTKSLPDTGSLSSTYLALAAGVAGLGILAAGFATARNRA